MLCDGTWQGLGSGQRETGVPYWPGWVREGVSLPSDSIPRCISTVHGHDVSFDAPAMAHGGWGLRVVPGRGARGAYKYEYSYCSL